MGENSRKQKAFKTENRLRVALYYSFQLLVDVLLLYVFIRAFSMSYSFSHDVFYDSAKNLKNKDYVSVTIEPDSSTKMVAEKIYDAGVIKNKYVLMAKIKVSEVGGDIKSGTYKLSQSMTYDEIIKIITGGVSTEEESETEEKSDTPTDASEIHDNSSKGAGEGSEGEGVSENAGKEDKDSESGDDSNESDNDESSDDSDDEE